MPKHARPACTPTTGPERAATCPDVTARRFFPASVRRPAPTGDRRSSPSPPGEDAAASASGGPPAESSFRALWRSVRTSVDRFRTVFEPIPEAGRDTGRRLLTFCLTDLEGSTRLWDVVPSEARAIFERHEELIAAAVMAHGGAVVTGRGEGDSTFSVFDCPTDAVHAAAAIVRALESEPWPTTEAIRARIGIHTGEVEVRRGNYFGAAICRAARLRGLAAGGEIMMSRTTADLVADSLPRGSCLVELGSVELRGLARPEIAVELLLGDNRLVSVA